MTPSRRAIIVGLGAECVGSTAGWTALGTTGRVARKHVTVGVPTRSGPPTDVTLAPLTYESDRRVATGEYADILPGVIEDSSIAVSESIHQAVMNRFAHVTYYANIGPEAGSPPVNGEMPRPAFNDLPIGGTATVDQHMKPVDNDQSVGHLRVTQTAPPEQPPKETVIEEYSWETRLQQSTVRAKTMQTDRVYSSDE